MLATNRDMALPADEKGKLARSRWVNPSFIAARSAEATADIRGGEYRRMCWLGGSNGRIEIERQCRPEREMCCRRWPPFPGRCAHGPDFRDTDECEQRSLVWTLRTDQGLTEVLAQHLPRKVFDALKYAMASHGYRLKHRLLLDSELSDQLRHQDG